MYPIVNLCFMCLNNSSNINVTNIVAKEIENLIPEIEIFKMDIPLRICSDCEKHILFFSVFKQACLVNIIQLQASITKAQSNNSPAAQNEYVEPGCEAKVVIRQTAVQISIKKDILKTNVPKPNPIQEKNNENYAVNNNVNVSSVNVNSIIQASDEVSVKKEKDVIQNNPEYFNDHVIKIENDNCEMNNIVNCNNVNETSTARDNHEEYIIKNEEASQEINCQNEEEISVKDDILEAKPIDIKLYYDVRETKNDNCIISAIVKCSNSIVNINSTDQGNYEVEIKKEDDYIKDSIINENPNDSKLYDDHVQEIRNKNSDIANNIDDEIKVDNDFHLTSIMKKQCGNGSTGIFVKEESSNILINQEQKGENENSNMNNTTNSNNVNVNKTDHINKETNLENEKTAQEINYQNTEKNSIINNIIEKNSNDRIYDEEVKIKKKDAIQDIANNIDDEMEVDDDYHLTSFMKEQRRKSTMEIFIKEESSNNNLINRKQERENENCKINNNANSNNVTVNNTDHMNNETGIENEKSELQINYENTEKNLEENSNDCIYGDVMKKQCEKSNMDFFIKAEIPNSIINREQEIQNKNCKINSYVNSNNVIVNNTDHMNNEINLEKEKVTQDVNGRNKEKKSIEDILKEIRNSHKLSGEVVLEVSNQKRKRNEIDSNNYTHESSTNDAQSGKTNTTQTFDSYITQLDNAKKIKKNNNLAPEIHDLAVEEMGIEEDTREENFAGHKFCNERDIKNKGHNTNKHINCRDDNIIHENHVICQNNINKAHSGKASETQTFDIPIQIDEEKESKKDNSTVSEIYDRTLEDDIIEVTPNDGDTHKVNTSKVENDKASPIKVLDIPIILLDEDNSKDNNTAPEIYDLTLDEICIREDSPDENPTGNKLCNEPTRGVSNKDCETNKNNYNNDNVNSTVNSTTQAFDISTTQLDNQKTNKIDKNLTSEKVIIIVEDILEASEIGDKTIEETSAEENIMAYILKKKRKKEIIIFCVVCMKKFTTKDALALHLKNHSNYFPCSKCKCWFTDKTKLMTHRADVHEDFVCCRCNKYLPNQVYLNRHKEHCWVTKFKCAICQEMFAYDFMLREHIQLNHKFTKLFTDTRELNVHKKKHIKKNVLRCWICSKVYISQDELDLHIKNDHDYKKEFPCPVCQKMFKRKSALTLHLEVHILKPK